MISQPRNFTSICMWCSLLWNPTEVFLCCPWTTTYLSKKIFYITFIYLISSKTAVVYFKDLVALIFCNSLFNRKLLVECRMYLLILRKPKSIMIWWKTMYVRTSIMNMCTFSKNTVYIIIYLGDTYDVYHRLIIWVQCLS